MSTSSIVLTAVFVTSLIVATGGAIIYKIVTSNTNHENNEPTCVNIQVDPPTRVNYHISSSTPSPIQPPPCFPSRIPQPPGPSPIQPPPCFPSRMPPPPGPVPNSDLEFSNFNSTKNFAKPPSALYPSPN